MRSGSHNCSDDDIDAFLDIVEDEEQLGANNWEAKDFELQEKDGNESNKRKHEKRKPFGAQKNHRMAGASGVRKEKGEDVLVEHVGAMSEAITTLLWKIGQPSGNSQSVTEINIRNVVKEEVKQELEYTNQSINNLKEMMKATISR